jgi:hypothetical protein
MGIRRHTLYPEEDLVSKIAFIAFYKNSVPFSYIQNKNVAHYVSKLIEEFLPDFKKSLPLKNKAMYSTFFQGNNNGRSESSLKAIMKLSGAKDYVSRRPASEELINCFEFIVEQNQNIIVEQNWKNDWHIKSRVANKNHIIKKAASDYSNNSLDSEQTRSFEIFFGLKKSKQIRVIHGLYYLENNSVVKKTKDGPISSLSDDVVIKRNRAVIGESTLNSILEFVNFFKVNNNIQYDIVSDRIASNFQHNCTIISIGGPDSCRMSKMILDFKPQTENPYRPKKRFFDFYRKNKPNGWVLLDLTKDKIYEIVPPSSKENDYSIIQKLRNSNGTVYFVCAGLLGHGTESAIIFLLNNWLDLHNIFKDQDFGLILQCSRESKRFSTVVYQVAIDKDGLPNILIEENSLRRQEFTKK